MYPKISPIVKVYAPKGTDLEDHLKLIEGFNSRLKNPTNWDERVYSRSNYLQKMLDEKAGNVVIIAGNNTRKMSYIISSLEAGINVLADKPIAVTRSDFELLRRAFEIAEEKKVILYDIMTERYDVINIIQREFVRKPGVFGELVKGSPDKPAVIMGTLHQLYKKVDNKTLKRPSWFFDTRHQGGAIADVGTHLVDLVQWMCFPDQILDWRTDVKIIYSKRWPTKLSLAQFQTITGLDEFPDQLREFLTPDNCLLVDKNGEVLYSLRGVHILLRTLWNYDPEPNACDTHWSVMRGSNANLTVTQGIEDKSKRALFIEKTAVSNKEFERKLIASISSLSERWHGLGIKARRNDWEVIIPEDAETSHEDHFSQVIEQFLRYITAGRLPEWETYSMIAKYFTTTEANDPDRELQYIHDGVQDEV
jgi:predicted dehydrogenase